MGGIGARLLTIRRQWQLSLREVEKRSLCLAQEKGNQSYQVSASWLHRLEREEHELSVSKLMALAEIYNVSPGQLLRCIDPGSGQNLIPRQLFPENASMILGEGSLEAQANLLSDKPVPAQPPDNETSLLAAENGQSPTPYRRGIIGKHDLTLHPMIPAGSIVQIDTQKRAISTAKKLDPRIPAAHLFPDDSGRLCLRLVRVGQKLRLADVDTAFAIASPKQEMEVQDRNRKHRACHHGGHSTSKLTIAGEQQEMSHMLLSMRERAIGR